MRWFTAHYSDKERAVANGNIKSVWKRTSGNGLRDAQTPALWDSGSGFRLRASEVADAAGSPHFEKFVECHGHASRWEHSRPLATRNSKKPIIAGLQRRLSSGRGTILKIMSCMIHHVLLRPGCQQDVSVKATIANIASGTG